MTLRLPWTVWWYVLSELWKLVLLTTAVLVTVIAFAMTIKPLADGKLDPLDTFRLMLMMMVPAMQYALPFAACFGATLAYHRLSSDNELTAAYAGGISHRAMLVPAACSGLVLGVLLLVLSHMVIPKMLRGMAEMITADAARIFVTQIERGNSVEIGRTVVCADKVVRQDPPPGYKDTLLLLGPLVIETGEDGSIESQVAARQATVWTRPSVMNEGGVDKPATEIIIKPVQFTATGEFGRGQSSETTIRRTVPNPFRDDPKFADYRELRRLREHPERIETVENDRAKLARELAEREVVDRIRASLREAGQVDLKKPDGERWLLRAGAARPVRSDGKFDPSTLHLIPPKGQSAVVLDRILPDGKVQRQSAASALLNFHSSSEPDRVGASFKIILREVVVDVIGGSPSAGEFAEFTEGELTIGKAEGKERPITDLTLLNDPLSEYHKKSSSEILRLCQTRVKDRPAEKDLFAKPAQDLVANIKDLMNEILSKEHERYAHSLACLVMVIVGAIMAMRLRDALPLTIYLWAFFPALVCVLAISGGQQFTHGQGPAGLGILYSGVAALLIFAGFEFFRLSKH